MDLNLTHGTVTGRYLSPIADGLDADSAPDAVAVNGTATFIPSIKSAQVTGVAGNSYTLLPIPIECKVVDGRLIGPDGSPEVRLVATDSDTNPSGWTYLVKFSLVAGSVRVSPPEFSFELPAGTTVDLSLAAPVTSSNGVAIVRGPKGDKGDPGTGGGGPAVGIPTFAQTTEPTEPGPWLWYDTTPNARRFLFKDTI